MTARIKKEIMDGLLVVRLEMKDFAIGMYCCARLASWPGIEVRKSEISDQLSKQTVTI
jgi:hypothetical protein